MEIRKNKIKALFQDGRPTFGIWNALPNTVAAEICGGAGFDWVLVDAEHAPFDIPAILTNIQALAPHESGIMVRTPAHDPAFIKKLLDIGVQSFLIPLVESKEQTEDLVKAVTYPPNGIRGVAASMVRATQWNQVPDYYNKVQEQICLVVQVETTAGMDNLEAICQVEGVDGVFIGPADLAASMGMIGQPTHETVKNEVKRGLKIINDAGKVAGTLAVDDDVINEYLEAGASFIGIGIDLLLLAQAAQELARKHVQSSSKGNPITYK